MKSKNMSSAEDFYAIIVAGGTGQRMGAAVPKQFLPLLGKPVLQHTLEQFLAILPAENIRLVLPEATFEDWRMLCAQHHFHPEIPIVAGGETRFHSVKHGLESLGDVKGWVAVHDGVRPLCTHQIIEESFAVARKKGNAIAAMPSKESVRLMTGDSSKALDRKDIYLVQTPQTFTLKSLQNAYQQEFQQSFTDDASVVERAGEHIHLFKGSYENVKITTPEDLRVAEAILKGRRETPAL